MGMIVKGGFAFENEVAEKLKRQGFTHVKVTKASRDYGADILAFKDGLEYVVQCKKYKGTVGYSGVKDVSTAMDIYQADRGILVCDTTFSRPAYEAVKKIDKPIELITLEEIKTWKTKEAKPTKYKPFSYQKSILTKLAKHRKQGNSSALLVMATGLGKTLLAAWDLKNQIKKGERALFLVHRKDILIDNAEKFYAIINDKKEDFKFGVYFEGKKFQKEDVIFSTFQTIIKHYKEIPTNYFNYIIIDEAHHSPAPTYSKVFSYFNPKFILGITATPKRITRVDNEFINKVFGKPLVNLDLAESLIRGYLSPVRYSVFCDNIDYEKLRAVNRKLSLEQLNQRYFIPTKDEDIEHIIQNEARKIKNPKVIIFCPTIKYINSVKMMGVFKDAEIYHSNMSDFDRTIVFRRFKIGKIKTILVVDLFNEGIDIPDANLIVFLRTTYSPTIFFQQLGRGIRKIPRKKYLRVLDFVGVLSKVRKIINAFGHLLIIQDFIEKIEKQKRLYNIHRGTVYKDTGFLEPLELDFYQAGRKVQHREILFKKKDFLSAIKFIKKHLIKSEGWTEEEIINELDPICKKLGYFPTRGDLIKSGRTDLTVQIDKYGGVYYFAEKLSYEASRKPEQYWSKWENLERALMPICNKLGKMPSCEYLKKIGNSGLVRAINYNWGGVYNVTRKLGYKTREKPKRFWNNWFNLKKELMPICKKLDKMPTSIYLTKINRGDLRTAIVKKWGGFNEVAKKLGYQSESKPRNYWNTWRNLKNELLLICKKLGKFPTQQELRKLNRHDIINTLIKFGAYKSAKKLGYKIQTKPSGFWNNWRNLKKELMPICRKLGKMPNGGYLIKIKRGDLKSAIQKWGGFSTVAKKLGYETSLRPRGYWRDWKNIKKELLPICKKLGRFPSPKELILLGKRDLISAFRNFGYIKGVAEKIGYKSQNKPKGYWNHWGNLKKELLPICKKLRVMPSSVYLRKMGRSDLEVAIFRRWGGIRGVAKKLGYQNG